MKIDKVKGTAFLCTLLTFLFFSFQFCDEKLIFLSEKNKALIYSFALIGIFTIYMKLWPVLKINWESKKLFLGLSIILSMFFSFMSFMGKYYTSDQKKGLTSILKGEYQSIKAALCFFGGIVFFFFVSCCMERLKELSENHTLRLEGIYKKIEDFLFQKRCFMKYFCIMLICWFPHIIIRYPGATWTDTWIVLRQYLGYSRYTAQHPMIYTLILGKFVDFGNKLGDPDYGLFTLIIVQVFMMLAVFSYVICVMEKLKISRMIQMITLVLFSVLPSAVATATTAFIDAPYAVAFLLFMAEMACYLFIPEEYKKSWKHLILTFVSVLGTFFRYNGIYIVAVMLCVICVREGFLCIRKRQNIIYSILICSMIFVPGIMGRSVVQYINAAYRAEVISSRAKYAMPMQQIARYMVYHGDDVSEEELEKIQKVVKWEIEDYKNLYIPHNFDGIKRGFQSSATKEEIREFLKVWLLLFQRHPGTYIEATVEQNCYLFSPLLDNSRYFKNAKTDAKKRTFDHRTYFMNSLKGREKWLQKQQDLMDYYKSFTQIPVLGLFVNQGWYVFFLLGICVSVLCRKNGRLLVLSLPLLLTIAIIVIGPAIYRHSRYMYPVMYSMPLFAGLYFRKE